MKSQIEIGSGLYLDIATLLKTRLLIQANSGGGKSWLLRRLAEQLFGKVPVIIIDPEGEFATLREKFGYVLVGKGGETPADLRSAAMVAHKLLELRASAVCDLYELKPQTRHQWVQLFLDALIDSPKDLWRPTVIVVDEAHQFCPEGKAGESEASSAMVDLATRGRKRGFCGIYATQRLGKLRKDAAAELLNVMVGMTFIDIDRERAAECLGVSREEKHKFNDEIKLLTEGKFYCLGRAICKERTLIKVGGVETTHPEAGGGKFAAEPPPAPEAIKGMLPKLADLPKAAEEKAKTEAELRTEIRTLKTKLTMAERAQPVAPSPAKQPIREVPALTDAERKRLTALIDSYERLETACSRIEGMATNVKQAAVSNRSEVTFFKLLLSEKLSSPQQLTRPPALTSSGVPMVRVPAIRRTVTPIESNGEWRPSKCQRAILGVLATNGPCNINKAAVLARYTVGGTLRTEMSSLRTQGCIVGNNSEPMQITEHGLTFGPFEQMPDTPEERIEWWKAHPSIGLCQRKVIDALTNNPHGLDINQLADVTGYEVGGTFRTELSGLRTSGVIVGRNSQNMVLNPDIFS